MLGMILKNASATSDAFIWPGGDGVIDVVASTYGTITLQYLGPDGVTWSDMGEHTTFVANGGGIFTRGDSKLRIKVDGATGVYATVNEILDRNK